MKLTQDVQIAIELVKFYSGSKPVPLSIFILKTRYNLDFAQRIASFLVRDGYLKAKQGPNGGYMRGNKSSLFDLVCSVKRDTKSYKLIIQNKQARHAMEQFLMSQMKTKKAV